MWQDNTCRHNGLPPCSWSGDYNKDTVINNLIVRIQNLLPDFCNMCQSEYCTKISEPAAISCSLCGQAAHKACIAEKLGISPEDLLLLRSEEVLKKVNPLKLKGIHHLCGACEENIIPSNESGKMNRRKSAVPENRPPIISSQEDTVAAESQSSESDNGDSQAPGPANATQVNTTEPSSAAPSDVTPVNSNNVRQTQDRGVASHARVSQRNRNDVTSASICRFYRKGTCRYGMSGTGCPKQHPKACRKLTQHGNRGPRGCNGENCNSFHPKMCPQSLRAGQCLTLDCKLRHVAGTRRTTTHSRTTTGTHSWSQNHERRPQQTQNSSSREDVFLELLNNMKNEIMELKMSMLSQQINSPQHFPQASTNQESHQAPWQRTHMNQNLMGLWQMHHQSQPAQLNPALGQGYTMYPTPR